MEAIVKTALLCLIIGYAKNTLGLSFIEFSQCPQSPHTLCLLMMVIMPFHFEGYVFSFRVVQWQ